VGGVDSLCLTTLHGFNSLQLVGTDICRPADAERKGISIGEAAGFAIVTASEVQRATAIRGTLLGYGESSDAHHMSAPHPEGLGAVNAMRAALVCAELSAGQIDYINLHGTGTPANDAAEDHAVSSVFGTQTPCSSTKGWTGHTLGAAGIIEAGLALLGMEHSLQPRSLNTRVSDPSFTSAILLTTRHAPTRRVLSNSFGFGGNNCSLILGGTP
jgi:3-oxoacyl-[acyl-carrier-protein] synthase-1